LNFYEIGHDDRRARRTPQGCSSGVRTTEAEAARAKADRDAAQKNKAAALAQENAKWKAQTQVIYLGVMASSNGFSRQGSKFLIAPRPREGANFVSYDIQENQ
jgi:hypothetical protein